MAGNKNKRRELTADDLMRMQEGPPRKRARLVEELAAEEDSGASRSPSEDEDEEDGNHKDGSADSGISTDDDEQDDEDDIEGSDEDEAVHRVAPVHSASRVTTIPRATLAAKPATPSARPRPTSWSDLDVSGTLRAALASMSIKAPTEIQSACIPPLLAGESSL
jgi:ATP-dependent RNA helicase DDX49/DBP8